MNSETVLEVKNLTVTLDSVPVLQEISFALHRKEALAVIGPNGAGKTTLIHALLGLIPYQGSVQWRPGIAIGYVPQRFSVSPSTPVTVTEFLLLKSPHFWLPGRASRDELADEISLVGLDPSFLDKPLATLSSGQVQRLLVSWAMLNHPDVLLFDEPTAAVDVGFSETIYSIMHRLTEERGTAILLTSHDLNVVFRYAANVLCINKNLLCHGPPSDFTAEELKRLYGEVAVYHHRK